MCHCSVLLYLSTFVVSRRFSCGGFLKLCKGNVVRVKNRRGDFTPLLREPVAMRTRHFPDQAVGTQEADSSRHLAGVPTRCFGVGGREGEPGATPVAVTEAVESELAAANHLQPRRVPASEMQGADSLAFPRDRTRYNQKLWMAV